MSIDEATTQAIEATDMLTRMQNMLVRPLHIPETPCLVGMLSQQINLMFYLMSSYLNIVIVFNLSRI